MRVAALTEHEACDCLHPSKCFRFPDLQQVFQPEFLIGLHLMLMWKPTGRNRRFAARSTPSAIAPGQSKSPYHSPLIFQCNPS